MVSFQDANPKRALTAERLFLCHLQLVIVSLDNPPISPSRSWDTSLSWLLSFCSYLRMPCSLSNIIFFIRDSDSLCFFSLSARHFLDFQLLLSFDEFSLQSFSFVQMWVGCYCQAGPSSRSLGILGTCSCCQLFYYLLLFQIANVFFCFIIIKVGHRNEVSRLGRW